MSVSGWDAIYARQSKMKEDSLSIKTQIEFCKKIAQNSTKVYTDEGISGKDTIHRPEYNRLMQDVERGFVKRIIVYKLDRFSRSLLDFAHAWDYLAKHSVDFVSATESFDTSSPIGKAMLFILATFAQMEREQISLRVKDNYYARVKLGRWPGGMAPYGFDIGKMELDSKINISTLDVADTMMVLDDICTQYNVPTASLGTVRKYLNELGIKSPSGENWSTCGVARVLRNPAAVKADFAVYGYYKELGIKILNDIDDFTGEYGGLLVGKEDMRSRKPGSMDNATFSIGNWPGVIESGKWLRCQKKLDSNRQMPNDGKGSYTWLSGLIKCGDCKRAVVIKPYKRVSGEVSRSMYCSGKDVDICKIEFHLKLDDVEKNVENELKKIIQYCKSKPISKVIPEENALRIQLSKLDLEIKNLMQAISKGGANELTMSYINIELEEITKKKESIFNYLKEKLIEEPALPDTIDFAKLDLEGQKIVAQTYIDKVYIYKEHIRIKWKI